MLTNVFVRFVFMVLLRITCLVLKILKSDSSIRSVLILIRYNITNFKNQYKINVSLYIASCSECRLLSLFFKWAKR